MIDISLWILPTVLMPSLADKIGPMVEPQGMSFLIPNSYRDVNILLSHFSYSHTCMRARVEQM